jgi:diguanylate cyclase
MSVGVAEFLGGETLEDLIERADNALYTAKHNGRNQVAAAPSIKK